MAVASWTQRRKLEVRLYLSSAKPTRAKGKNIKGARATKSKGFGEESILMQVKALDIEDKKTKTSPPDRGTREVCELR